MRADLHLHSTYSDGRLTPAEVVAAACRSGLDAIALTDHDTTAGVEIARQAVREQGLRLSVLAGIEVSTVWNGQELHILGYGIEPEAPSWAKLLAGQAMERERRMERLVAALEAHGLPVTLELVRREAGNARVGRAHLARALVKLGAASSEQSAFDRYLNPECPTYVERQGLSPFEAIAAIHAAGGVASLAHPHRSGVERAQIAELAGAGLDAIEVNHPSHSPTLRDYYGRLGSELALGFTGGSDDHGPRGGEPSAIGSVLAPHGWRELGSFVGKLL